jgi:hypothetical protein
LSEVLLESKLVLVGFLFLIFFLFNSDFYLLLSLGIFFLFNGFSYFTFNLNLLDGGSFGNFIARLDNIISLAPVALTVTTLGELSTSASA